ncbi:MAG: hypothetical protein IPH06_04440 [Alphaproteobacteria bacterium]|nr:hypothetical protein [Alphaproteobacteria bacterium]QQS57281.1 MAG: hypothetical protein IPN28_00200 [Alphaproteobacteria bacterium]
MKYLLTLLLLVSAPLFAQDKIALELIIDDSGVLLDAGSAQTSKMMLLAHLKALASKRAGAHARVNVISTSLGRTVWSGTPLELRRDPLRAQALVDAITADPARCNNLPGAFAELKSNLAQHEREGVHGVQVVIFSSLVDTPRPCSAITHITLPQMPPEDGDINGALLGSANLRSLAFFWVSPHQKRVWEEFLAPSFEELRARGIPVTFLDVERSLSALRSSPFSAGETP